MELGAIVIDFGAINVNSGAILFHFGAITLEFIISFSDKKIFSRILIKEVTFPSKSRLLGLTLPIYSNSSLRSFISDLRYV